MTTAASSRVLTVTLNPALDVSMSIERLVPDRKLRAPRPLREPGGGGVNVSRVLFRMGTPVSSFVVAGGSVGAELVRLLRSEGVHVIDFPIEDNTRESLAISESTTGAQYRISVPGPAVGDLDALRRGIADAAAGAHVVVFSGSLPPSIPPEFLGSVVEQVSTARTTIVDTSGPALELVARRCATIIKPSQRELAALVGWKPTTTDQIEQAVAEVVGWGAVRAVVASRGPSGVVLMVRETEPMWFRPPPVHPVSTVGAGDSMVAGITAGLVRGQPIDEAVRFGVAAGTAAVLTPGSELCDLDDIDRLVGHVRAG